MRENTQKLVCRRIESDRMDEKSYVVLVERMSWMSESGNERGSS